jgi:hypothetical protein
MNKISFKGSNVIIADILSRFFVLEGKAPPPLVTVRERYGKILGKISAARSVDLSTLETLFDFLITHGVTEERLDRLTGERIDDLVQLVWDVETLRKYRRDGTITDVRIVDE